MIARDATVSPPVLQGDHPVDASGGQGRPIIHRPVKCVVSLGLAPVLQRGVYASGPRCMTPEYPYTRALAVDRKLREKP